MSQRKRFLLNTGTELLNFIVVFEFSYLQRIKQQQSTFLNKTILWAYLIL